MEGAVTVMENLSELLSLSLGGYSLSRILSALVTLLICLGVVRLALRLLGRLLSRMEKLGERLQKLILTGVKAVLYLLAAIITAEALGVNTTSLTAIMSVLTLGITLAAEDILGNVAGGLVILSSRPFSIGDVIEVGDTIGTVREVSLNHTKLETYDGQIVLQPNRALSSAKIVNYTVFGRRRIACNVRAPYETPTGAVKEACMEAMRAVPGVLNDPAPAVYLLSFGTSAVEYGLRCWTKTDDYWDACYALNEALRAAFARHGIAMPYDHLNVHLTTESGVKTPEGKN